MPRQVEELEFRPDDPLAVVARMELMVQAADGWVNVVPRVAGDEDGEEGLDDPRLGFSALFGGVSPPHVPLCTWVPRAPSKGGGATLGILHAKGRRSVQVLRDAGVAVPPSWRVEQDHQRRGLVLRVDADTGPAEALSWTCRAAAVLCVPQTTGMWLAYVHLPKLPAQRTAHPE
jgi:hypothetical protein